MKSWRPARNAAPATPAELSAGLTKARNELAALEAEAADIANALPDLVVDPETATAARHRLAELDAMIPVARRTLESIREAIPAAEMREREARLRADIVEQRGKSNVLRRDMRSRFERAAHALATVLNEIEADNHAWTVLNAAGREFGLPFEDSAEKQLRANEGHRPGGAGWFSIADDIVVRDWTGRILSGGRPGTY